MVGALAFACDDDDNNINVSDSTVVEEDASFQDAEADAASCNCPGRQRCNVLGDCVSREPCAGDEDCEEGRVCESLSCVKACQTHENCTDPKKPFCNEGHCATCIGDDDCPGNQKCEQKSCVEPAKCEGIEDCLEDRVCAFETRLCMAAFDCHNDGCPGAFVCTDSGACVALGQSKCKSDAECPLGDSCVDNVCSPCAEAVCAAGCVDDPLSHRAFCGDAASCQNNYDCAFNRICERSQCVAPGCADDNYEDNDLFTTALPIQLGMTYSGLQSCDDDFYRITLPAKHVGLVSLRRVDEGGRLSLAALDSKGALLAASSNGAALEAVEVGPFGDDREITIQVTQPLWSGGQYELSTEALEVNGESCIDDVFELGTGDDTQMTGRWVDRGADQLSAVQTGRACPGDDDFMCFMLQPQELFSAELSITSGSAKFYVDLYNSDGEKVVSKMWSRASSEILQYDVKSAGRYCVGLSDYAGEGVWSLALNSVSSAAREKCDAVTSEPAVLKSGESVTLTGALAGENVFVPSCAPDADGAEQIWPITVQKPGLLTAELQGVLTGGLGSPVISVRKACSSASSELGCAADAVDPKDPMMRLSNPAMLKLPVTEGNYWVFVDGKAPGLSPDYRLTLGLSELSAAPDNERFQTASLLSFRNGRAAVNADLAQAKDDVLTCLPAGGVDSVYRFTLEKDSHLKASVQSELAAGLALFDARFAPVACGYGFEADLPAGDYYLVAEMPNAGGVLHVELLAEQFQEAIENATCAAAKELTFDAPISGYTVGRGSFTWSNNNRCTGYNTEGPEAIYKVSMQAGQTLDAQVIPVGGWDVVLSLLSDCSASATCLDGSDGALAETVRFTASTAGTYYLIIDGSNGEYGQFLLQADLN